MGNVFYITLGFLAGLGFTMFVVLLAIASDDY